LLPCQHNRSINKSLQIHLQRLELPLCGNITLARPESLLRLCGAALCGRFDLPLARACSSLRVSMQPSFAMPVPLPRIMPTGPFNHIASSRALFSVGKFARWRVRSGQEQAYKPAG